jgi:hypothetical protein
MLTTIIESVRNFRKTEWVMTDISVRLLRGKVDEAFSSRKPVATYSNKNGTRQSKRLRQARDNEKRRLAVTKKTTIKDVKIKVGCICKYNYQIRAHSFFFSCVCVRLKDPRKLQHTHNLSTTLLPWSRIREQ